MRSRAAPLALLLGACLHGPVGATWYGRGPNTSPPSDPLRTSPGIAKALASSEQSCRAVLEEASALGYEPASSGQPCLRTREKSTPFYLSLQRDAGGGVRRELTYAWRGDGVEGAAYVPAYPAQRSEAQRQQAALLSEWAEVLSRAAERVSAAAGDQRTAQAAAHFDRAVGLYRDGQLGPALAEFEAAYAAQPRWEVLYNVAVAQQKLSRAAKAHASFARYLSEGGAKVPAKRRADVEKAMGELESRLGRVNLAVVGRPTDVQLDGESLGAMPPAVLLVEPGRHEFKAWRGEQLVAGIAVALASGETSAVLLEVPER